MTLPMHLVFIINSLAVLDGGPPRVLSELSSRLIERGYRITIVSRPCAGLSVALDPSVNCLYLSPKIINFCGLFSQSRSLSSIISSADAVIVSGIWGILEGLLLHLSSWSSTPVYIRACGMLEPYILAKKPFLKQLARSIYVNRNITRSSGLIVNTSVERDSILARGICRSLHVIPNGSRLPLPSELLERSECLSILNLKFSPEQNVILFLARLHPKKGLHNLLRALAIAQIVGKKWQLVVAGDGYPSEQYRRLIHHLSSIPSISDSVHFVGEVYDLKKNAVLSLANLFVLPSESEGFPNAVIEAMAWSTPVLVSPGCNFPQVEAESAGWIVNPTPYDLSKRLSHVISDPNELIERGLHARRLVSNAYSIDKVVDMYEELVSSNCLRT